MAARKTVAEKNAETAEKVENEATPETPENVTDETANDENADNGENGEEESLSPLEEEMEDLPHTPKPAVNGLLPIIAEQTVRFCEAKQIVLNNTLSPEGIENFAKTDSDEELVRGRNEIDARNKDIEKLKAQIIALEEANTTANGVLLKRAESLMAKNIKKEEKEKAELAQRDARKQVGDLMGIIKTTLYPEWEKDSDMFEYLGSVNRRLFGGQTTIRTTGGRGSAARRRWNQRARTWLKDHNWDIGEKGRIPLDGRQEYVKHNPNDPEPA